MPPDVLQGWKSIAAYLQRDERTVRRWEKQRALPVRRLAGGTRGVVYALAGELDAWLRESPEPADAASVAAREPGQSAEQPEQAQPPSQALPAVPHVSPRRVWMASVAAAAAASVLLIAILHRGPGVERGPIQAASHVADQRILRAEFFLEQRSPAALDRALHTFEEAAEANPGNAAAWAGVAKTYCLLRQYAQVPSAVAFPRAEAAARRALANDPDLPEAHAALGFVLFFWQWQPGPAEREFQRALQLNPDSTLAHHWYGSMLTHQRRTAAALLQLDVAQRLQPASPSILANKAYALSAGNRRDEAAALLAEVIEADPAAPSPHRVLAAISIQAPRDVPRYLRELRRSAELGNDAPGVQRAQAAEAAYRRAGEPAMWQALLAAEMGTRHGELPSFAMAQIEAASGRSELALRHLRQLQKRHDALLSGLAIDPHFEPLHADARYQALLRELGLEGADTAA